MIIDHFAGREDARQLFNLLAELAHTWDDLIDRDKPVSQAQTNRAFHIALVDLPRNPLYSVIQPHVLAMWTAVVSNYAVANSFETAHDDHGIEIAHMLRYSAGNIMAVAMDAAVGTEAAEAAMPGIWKLMVAERFDDYRKEHTQ
jgi:DNA-binding FadR family transcriptional regulator